MVREIFELCAGGEGLKGVAKRLNAAGAPAPRAQQGRRSGWAPSSVREVLHRSLYRGEIVWNRTKKRDAWGQKRRRARPEAEWVSVLVESLRIVPEALWRAAHARMTERRSNHERWKCGEGGAPDGRGVRTRSDGGALIPSRLHEDVDDVAVLVHGTPQVLLATVQGDEQLIEMPRVSEAPAPVPEPSGIRAAERVTPPSDRLIGDRDAPLGQQVLVDTKPVMPLLWPWKT